MVKEAAATAVLFTLAVLAAPAQQSRSKPGLLPVEFSVRVSHDSGHGGSSETWTLKREDGKFVATVLESRYFPRPGERDFKPQTASKTAERAAHEARRFLAALVDDLKIGELETLQTRVVLLHPTVYDFEVSYGEGRVHRFKCVIEGDDRLDERYRRLIEECTRFFGG